MAELEDGWMPASDAPVHVEIEKLDFPFVESCNDWKQLYNILRVLKSGKEGFYPDLERTTEQKLLSVMPEKIRRRYLAVKSSATPSQIAEAEDELAQWLSKANMLDAGLKSGRADGHRGTDASGRAHWTLLRNLSAVQASKISKLQQDLKCAELSPIQLERKAELERRKGNECYRAGEHAAALNHYTRSIAYQDDIAAAWANRAMAYIKTEIFDLAEIDCSIALLLDPDYKKARSRRGLVRFKRGKYKEAAEDFQEVVNQSGGTDKEAHSMLAKALEKFQEIEGYALVFDTAVPDPSTSTGALRTVRATPCEAEDMFLPASTAQVVAHGSFLSPSPAPAAEFVRVQILAESDDEESDSEDNSQPPAPPSAEEQAIQLKEKGNDLVKAGRSQEAIELYDQSLQLHYTLITVNNRAQAKLNVQDYSGAAADCTIILDQEPDNAKALFRRAKVWMGLKDLQRALEDINQVLQVQAQDSSALSYKEQILALRAQSEQWKTQGNAAMEIGSVQEAIRCYSKAVEVDRSNFAAWNNRALAYIKSAQFTQAEEDAGLVLASRAQEELKQKALFRRAEARYRLAGDDRGKLNSALQDLDALREKQSAAAQNLRTQILAKLQPAPSPSPTKPASNPLPPPPPAASSKITEAVAPPRPPSPPAQPAVAASKPAKASSATSKAKEGGIKKVKVSVPSEPPRTLYEFERVWRSLNREPLLRAEYLALFTPASFKRVFKDSIATELLGSVFVALQASRQEALILRVLGELGKLPMLSFALTMLPQEETAALADILSVMQASTAVDGEAVQKLVGLYNPTGSLSGAK